MQCDALLQYHQAWLKSIFEEKITTMTTIPIGSRPYKTQTCIIDFSIDSLKLVKFCIR